MSAATSSPLHHLPISTHRHSLTFANFYRTFVKNSSKICVLLTRLFKKNSVLTFDEAARTSFQSLKTAFTEAPILRHFDPQLPIIIIGTDASDFAIAAILAQPGKNQDLHSVAFYSRQMTPPQLGDPCHRSRLQDLASLRGLCLRPTHHTHRSQEFWVFQDFEDPYTMPSEMVSCSQFLPILSQVSSW